VFYLKNNYFSDRKMSDSDNLESESDQPPAKKAKSNYDTPSSHR
jgi:hypothetical protein